MIHQYRPSYDWHELLAMLRFGKGRGEFEQAVAARVGSRYGVAFAYGRSALVAVCKVLGLAQDEVIIPAYTCNVVAEAVVVSGNKPVFVDVDLADYNMNIGAMKDALTSKTRVIVATHMHGYPADIGEIRATVGDDRIVIVEDAALLGPVSPNLSGIKSRGDIAIFSFGPGKHLYAVRGGVVVTDSADLYEKLRAYRDREMSSLPGRVWVKRLARLMTGYMMLHASIFEVWNRVNQIGPIEHARDQLGLTKVSMPNDYATAFTDFQGRVGLTQLRKFDAILAGHRAWAEFYDRELRDVPGIILAPIIEGSTYSHYALRVKRRDELDFRQRMRAEGVEVGTAFDSVVPYLEPYRPYANGPYPCADRLASEVVNLPNYPALSPANAQHITKTVRKLLLSSDCC